MTRIFFVFVPFIFFISSCNTDKPDNRLNEIRDSALNKYFSIVDTLPYYDTNNVEFKILKAYSRHDTNRLKKILGRFENINTTADWEVYLDSCVKQQPFKDISAVEKYRFNYSVALFCPYVTSITIIKYEDSILLQTIVYQKAWDTIPCKVIEKSTLAIDSLSWDKFQQSMEISDFWGLKLDNGKHGLDGSTLSVYGFKRGTNSEWDPDKSNFISRWGPKYNSIFGSFVLLLEFSKTNKGCIAAPL